jgi:hypothetical protein
MKGGYKMRVGEFFVCLWLFLFSVSSVWAKCGTQVINRAVSAESIIRRATPKSPVELKSVLPEYDSKTEVLFLLRFNHSSLYFGKYFWDWDGSGKFRVRTYPKVIAAQLVIRLRVGEATVTRLEEQVASGRANSTLWGSCIMRTLYLLNSVGVRPNGPVPLTVLQLIETTLLDGFVDDTGAKIPQTVYALETPGQDLIPDYVTGLRRHHVDYFYMFMGLYGVPPSIFAMALREATTDSELLAIPALLNDLELANTLSERQRRFMLALIFESERNIQRTLDRLAGSSYVALAYASYLQVPPQAPAEVMLAAFRQTIPEVLATLDISH